MNTRVRRQKLGVRISAEFGIRNAEFEKKASGVSVQLISKSVISLLLYTIYCIRCSDKREARNSEHRFTFHISRLTDPSGSKGSIEFGNTSLYSLKKTSSFDIR